MDLPTPVQMRATISTRTWSKGDEEIIKKLYTHPERLSSGELAKTLLSTFSKNLGKFSSATTFDVYLRWLEAQRHAPQTTINYNWKNVITQWAQSLKARNFTLKELVFEVEQWKKTNGPFKDPKTEENPRYPPTIDQLEFAYKMDLKAHGLRKTSISPFVRKVGDCYTPGLSKRGSGVPEPTTMPVKHSRLQWCDRCRARTSSVGVQGTNRIKRADNETNHCNICGLLRDNGLVSRQDASFLQTMSPREHIVRDIKTSPPKQRLCSPNNSPPRTSSTIGLFVMNVGDYTNDEVVQIFNPDCRHKVTRLEAWLTNRTVHFETIEDRDRAYYFLPDDLKTRKERDLTRPLVKIFSDTGNKPGSDIDNRHVDSLKKNLTQCDDNKYMREEVGLCFTNVEKYSRKDVEILLDERDISNIVSVERLGKSNIVVLFPTTHLRDMAMEHLPSHLKDLREASGKTSPLVVPFNPILHGGHAEDPRESQSSRTDKFYSTREDANNKRIVNSFAVTHKRIPRWEHNHYENYDSRLPNKRFGDDGQLSRHDAPRDSNPGLSCHSKKSSDETENSSFHQIKHHDDKRDEGFNAEKYMAWEQDHVEVVAEQWLEKLADEIMERSGKLDKLTCDRAREVQKHLTSIEDLKETLKEDSVDKDAATCAALIVNGVGSANVSSKRSRSTDGTNYEIVGDGSKRARHENKSPWSIKCFMDEISDEDGLDCSSLDLTRMKRPNALHMWNIHDKVKRQVIRVESKANSSSEKSGIAEVVNDFDNDGEGHGAEKDPRRPDEALGDISSPEDGWCSSRDYWAGSSGASNASDREECRLTYSMRDSAGGISHKSSGIGSSAISPGADTAEIANSRINLDVDMAYL